MGRKDVSIEEISKKNLIAEYEAAIYLSISPAQLRRMRINDPSFAAVWKSGRKLSRPALDEWLVRPGTVEVPANDIVEASELVQGFESKL